ncbi:MAG: SMP-30/gluconolactonase/LRE family protein [Gemmatimonadaceae bacterium]
MGKLVDLLRRTTGLLRHQSARSAQLVWPIPVQPGNSHGDDATFGECPVWHAARGELFWLDIPSGVLRAYHTDSRTVKSWPLANPSAGLALEPGQNTMLVGQELQLLRFDPTTKDVSYVATVPGGDSGERINDLRFDAVGSLWVATMDKTATRPTGRLLRRSRDDVWETMLDGVPIMNGPAFNDGGDIGYACDTTNRRVLRFDVPAPGMPLVAQEFARFAGADGYPDGIAVAPDGSLWVAHYAGACLTRWDSTGRCVERVAVNARNTTSVAIVGRNLYITTAALNSNDEKWKRSDSGGGLFMLQAH